MINKLDLHDHPKESYNCLIDTVNNNVILAPRDGLIRFEAFNRFWEYTSNKILINPTLEHNSLYLLWAYFNDTATILTNFALTKKAESLILSIGSGGNKGTSMTFDVTDSLTYSAYQFVVGSRVWIYKDNTNYNLATVSSITDSNTMVVQLDNDSSYGTNLSSTGHTVKQMNNFKPIDVSASYASSAQTEYKSRYKLLNYCVLTDSSGLFSRVLEVNSLFNLTKQVEIPNTNNTLSLESQTGIKYSEENNSYQLSNKGTMYYDLSQDLVPNIIQNGAMNIWQRGTTATNITAATVTYYADRFYHYHGTMGYTTVPTIERSSTVPANQIFQYSALIKNLETISPVPSGAEFVYVHRVEGYNFRPLVNKRGTLSFWIRSSKVGTYCIGITNNGADRSYVVEYTINTANTWEFKEITLDFNYSGGIWDYTNGIGLQLVWVLASNIAARQTASTNQWLTGLYQFTANQVNFADSNTATMYITGIQLHEGEKARQFEVKSFNEELSECQRYYEKSFDYGVAPANINTVTNHYTGAAYSTDRLYLTIFFKTRKRINTATYLFYNDAGGTAGTWIYWSGGVLQANKAIALDTRNEQRFTVYLTDAGALTLGHGYLMNGHWTASADL